MYVQALSVQVRTEYAPNIPFYLGLLSPSTAILLSSHVLFVK